MKITPRNSMMLNILRSAKGAWLEYVNAVLDEECSIENLTPEKLEAAKMLKQLIYKHFIKPVTLSEKVEPSGTRERPEDFR
jgi:hypothetical protein